jgi:hypothetical protein
LFLDATWRVHISQEEQDLQKASVGRRRAYCHLLFCPHPYNDINPNLLLSQRCTFPEEKQTMSRTILAFVMELSVLATLELQTLFQRYFFHDSCIQKNAL